MHPIGTLNPPIAGGNAQSQAKFIELTTAYKHLLTHAPSGAGSGDTERVERRDAWQRNGTKVSVAPPQATAESSGDPVMNSPTRPEATPGWGSSPPVVQFSPELSDMDRRLKQQSYDQLQILLKTQRFPRAIALVEGLAQRLPEDREVRQWQAITYQRWGRQLIQEKQYDKARVYLKKALKVDPHNRQLWAEVEGEFQRLEQVYR